MMHYAPSRLVYGEDITSLVITARLISRLGTRALLVADGNEPGSIDKIRVGMERAGIDAILYDGAEENARGDSILSAIRLFADSRALFIVTAGSPSALSLGKLISRGASNPSVSADELIDRPISENDGPTVPYVAVPTRLWNPLIFSDLAIVTDSRDRSAQPVWIGSEADTVLCSRELVASLTEKQVVYDLLCILQSSYEASHQADPAVDLPMLLSAMSEASSEAGRVLLDDYRLDRGAIQRLGLRAAQAAPRTSIAASVGWATHSIADIPIAWTTASVFPEIAGLYSDSPRNPSIADAIGVDSAVDISAELRSLTALADIPLRLRDLDIDSTHLDQISIAASGICGAETSIIRDCLEHVY